MPDEVTVKMHGVDEINKSIRELAIASPLAVQRGVLRVAMKIERQAKLNITANGYSPATKVRTGITRASITTNWTGSGHERGVALSGQGPKNQDDAVGKPLERKDTFTAVTGTNVKWGRRLEFGFMDTDSLGRRFNQQAKPYLFPAYFAHEGDVKDEISLEVGKELAKAMKK